MILCEPICDGAQHIPFNSATIKGVLNLFPGDVRLLCSHSHWQALMNELDENSILRIRHIPINILTRKDDLKSWLSSFRLLLKIKSMVESQENIMFLSSTSGIIDLASSIFRSNSVKCVVHMLLARVELPIPRNPVTRFFSLNSVLKRFKPKSVEIIVLEENIRDNLIKIHRHLKEKTKILVHPLPLDKVSCTIRKNNIYHCSICFPGTFNKSKGAYDFIKLSKSCANDELFNFTVAGKQGIDLDLQNAKSLKIPPSNEFLSRQTFAELVSTSDFLFLGHQPQTYKWCASGVYNDAIFYGVPIIARKSTFFESEFLKYGEFGLLFETIEQVIEFLRSDDYVSKYELFARNIETAKTQRSKDFLVELEKLLR